MSVGTSEAAAGELNPEGIADRTTVGVFFSQAARYGDRPLVHYKIGEAWKVQTWADMKRDVLAVASALFYAHGVKAVSFGGGEPLQYEAIFEVLERLRGVLFRSLTTSGLKLEGPMLDRLAAAAPEKVHVSIHFPERSAEVERVIGQVGELAGRGLRTGLNLLVSRSHLGAAARAPRP